MLLAKQVSDRRHDRLNECNELLSTMMLVSGKSVSSKILNVVS